MHFADSIVIFLLALVLFGPKKLPEIGRQIGKLLAEFRRASNDFKMQIDDELRAMEQQERQKKLEAAAAEAEKTRAACAGEPDRADDFATGDSSVNGLSSLDRRDGEREFSLRARDTAGTTRSRASGIDRCNCNIDPGSSLQRPRRRIRCRPAERRGDEERRYPCTSWMIFSTAPDRR